MTHEEAKALGATHYDSQDYWMQRLDKWFIWLDSCKRWHRVHHYKKFHDLFPIKPL